MTVVPRRDIGLRLGGVVRGARTACVGLGYTMLVSAAGVALWGWLVAEPSVFEGMWDPFGWVHQYAWRNKFPVGPAVSVVCIAAALIGVSAYAWRRRGRPVNPIMWLIPQVSAMCAVLYFAALSFGLAPFYRLVMGNYPVTPAVPMVVASWLLGFGGAVALLAAMPLQGLTRKDVPVVAGGVAVGVIAALVLTMMAARAGDDRRYVDATVAPAVDVPAEPATFGPRRFSLKVSDWQGVPKNQPDVQVAAAGAGFVVFHGGQVTAYGSDGKERWHYRRTGPGRVSVIGFRVFDEGRTVVAAVAVGPTHKAQVLVGLDAVTGHQLWSARSPLQGPEADSFYPERGTHGEGREPSPFLIANRSSDSSPWTRLDIRTGKPIWTVDAPVGRDCHGRVADTQSRIATAISCLANNKIGVGVVVLDPVSGQQLWRTSLASDIPDRADHRFDMRVTPAGRDGIQLTYRRAGNPATQIYVNVVSHVMRDLGVHDRVEASPQRGDVFVVEHSRQPNGTDLSLYDSNGVQRCTLSPGMEIPQDLMGDYHLYLPLANVVVVYDRNSHTFRTVDNNTCAVLATQPTSSAADWLAAAPGVVLVQRIGADGTYIDGYA